MIVYTDGSRIPGQDNRGYAGIGIYFGNNDCRNTSTPITSLDATNQYAELFAIYRALIICREIIELTIRSDSDYSIKCITVWSNKWIKNGWVNSKGDRVVNYQIIRHILDILLEKKALGHKVHFEHVYGHRNDEGNNGADKLAVAASTKLERSILDNIVYFYNDIDGEYRCFSHSYPCVFDVTYGETIFTYNCAEQYYNQQKALLFHDQYIADEIMNCKEPHLQEELGGNIKNFDQEVWMKDCYQIVRKCNVAKFKQHPDILNILLSTRGRLIAQASPKDYIWGIGISISQSKSKVKWKGQNLLGKLLVDIRDNEF